VNCPDIKIVVPVRESSRRKLRINPPEVLADQYFPLSGVMKFLEVYVWPDVRYFVLVLAFTQLSYFTMKAVVQRF
jgi:hypothetical protein